MILRALGDVGERRGVEARLTAQLTGAMRSRGVENIGYPGGNTNTPVHVDDRTGLWFAREDHPAARVPRYWNAFGFYQDGRRQQITVEINVPIQRLTGQVAGAFARDDRTGDLYLLHSGKVGGGAEGVGKTQFLVWSEGRLDWCDVVDAAGARSRPYIVIGQIGAADLPERIARFTRMVADFKIAVRNGELSTPAFRKRVQQREEYQREFSGRKTGQRSSNIDYFSYHGDVVDALRTKLIDAGIEESEIGNSDLIDLYVKSGSTTSAVYEVKTQTNRSSIYTGIGQLMVHAPEAARRRLVLPEHQSLPDDIEACLKRQGIELLQFRLEGGRRKTVIFL